MDLSKDEQWILDLFSVQKTERLMPRQIVNLWLCTFPYKELRVLREAVKRLEDEKFVEREDSGSLILVSKSRSRDGEQQPA